MKSSACIALLLSPLSALSIAWANPPATGVASPAELFLGSVAMDVPANMVKRLSPLTQYLSQRAGTTITFRASPSMGSAVKEFGNEFTQIAYFTPMAYIEAHAKFGAQPLAAPLTKGASAFNLVIAVAKDSPVRSVGDLKGKSFAFGDEKALLQRAVVVGSGLALTDLSRHAFLNHYDNIAKAVLNGDFDAGVLKDTTFDQYAARGLRSVHVSPPLAGYVFAVGRQVPPEMVKKLRAALLELSLDTAEGRAVLQGLDPGYTGFKAVSDQSYDPIRKLIEPFQAK